MIADQAQKLDTFTLKEPVLVVRWRLAGGHLPLENRHLRSFSHRLISDRKVTRELLAWAKQHIEWTLEDGAKEFPDGVLMIVVDKAGCAAMTCGAYEPLSDTSEKVLLGRAENSALDAQKTGVASETVWIAKDGMLICADQQLNTMSGISTLIRDLCKTLGIPVQVDEGLLDALKAGYSDFDGLFLASDEHGIVICDDAGNNPECDNIQRMHDGYQALLKKTAQKR